MKKSGFFRRIPAVLLAAAFVSGITACQGASKAQEEKPQMLSMGTDQPGTHAFMAGAAVASAINNGYKAVHVDIKISDGSPINVKNVIEGEASIAMISGSTAFEAWDSQIGTESSYDGKKLCALGACYPECSQWIAFRESGIHYVNELKGKSISAGVDASVTEAASRAVFETLKIDEINTELFGLGLRESADALREGKIDSAHSFYTAPFEAFEILAGERETVLLEYREEELESILCRNPSWCRIVIPAGQYPGQEKDIVTFGQKVLLCTSTEMDEETAYGIAKALDQMAAEYTGGHRFMASMQDKDFLCNDLPVPLHPGAERYYREAGYRK